MCGFAGIVDLDGLERRIEIGRRKILMIGNERAVLIINLAVHWLIDGHRV